MFWMLRPFVTLFVASWILLASAGLSGCAARAAGQDLGGGFRLTTPGDLYYRKAHLGRVDYVSVSPSGAYAVFRRGDDLLLMKSGSGNLKPVVDGDAATPRDVIWHEADGFAEIEYTDGRPSSRVELG